MRRNEEVDYTKSIPDAFFQVFFMALISYLNYFLWLPRFLKHKNLGRYFLEFIVPFLIIVGVHISIKKFIYTDVAPPRFNYFNSVKFAVTHSLTSLFIVVFVGMLKFVEDWFELDARKKEIENEKLTAELQFLKAQVNPHFLFNTLNNLYYLATVNSPKTPEVIDKLSQMMRYMLYETNHQKVALIKEIDYMKNYIELEKLRLDNHIPINFSTIGNTDGIKIVPLILITFLENAFKHGVSNNSKNAFVNISIDLVGKKCTYVVENSKIISKIESTNAKSGIGLQNVKRRLDLIYPYKYELNIIEDETIYKVTLSLYLD